MTGDGWWQIALFLAALVVLTKPLGLYMSRVLSGQPTPPGRLLGPCCA
jgi:K+-transporting ATPase ATPase A chain